MTNTSDKSEMKATERVANWLATPEGEVEEAPVDAIRELLGLVRSRPPADQVPDMVERVARALCVESGDDPDDLDNSRICKTDGTPLPLWAAYEGAAIAALQAVPAASEVGVRELLREQSHSTPDAICDFLHELDGWERAYPLSAFPEPDMRKAAELLKAGGMTLDAISASNMRHVVSQIAPKAADLIQQQQATIERLSAALERFADFANLSGAAYLPDDHVITLGSGMAARQLTMGDCRKARAALRKDASDVRSPGSSEGE